MSFTLFVILPYEDICTLRNLPSRTSIRAVRKRLELAAGLPAQVFRLSFSDGQSVDDDYVFRLEENVWDGFVIRASFVDKWQDLHSAVVANDVDHVIHHSGVHVRGDVVWVDGEDDEAAREVVRQRGVVALFVASFLGLQRLCQALLSVGVHPDGKTTFGRTALFAAMSRDHAHVVDLLLSHSASVETRDQEGVTAVDVARRQGAKECLRKVRHLVLRRSAHSAPPSSTRRTPGPGRQSPGNKSCRVVRIPTGAETETTATSSSTTTTTSTSAKDGHRRLRWCEDDFLDKTSSRGEASSPGLDLHREGGQREDCAQNHTRASSGVRPTVLFPKGVVYSWEDNLQPLSRASSAAGTYVRTPVVYNSRDRISSGRSSHGGRRGHAVSWNDTSASSTTSRLMAAAQDGIIRGPPSVLTVSSIPPSPSRSSTPRNARDKDREDAVNTNIRSSTTTPTSANLTTTTTNTNDNVNINKNGHNSVSASVKQSPLSEPTQLLVPGSGQVPESNVPEPSECSAVNDTVPAGSQDIQNPASGCSRPADTDETLNTTSKTGDGDGGRLSIDLQGVGVQGESEDGARTMNKASPPSQRPRSCRPVLRRKRRDSVQRMKRQLKLSENQKRATTPKTSRAQLKAAEEAREANFAQWLERKRREKLRHHSSDTSSDSDDDEGGSGNARMKRTSAENARAFRDWLRELKERPHRGPFPYTVASLHRRKSRPLKNLIQIGVDPQDTVPPADTDGYISAYRQWRQDKTSSGGVGQSALLQNRKEAQRQLREKRKSMLAVALTYEDWLDLSEERQKLEQAVLRPDSDKLATVEQNTRRDSRQISFEQWREKVEKKEAEIRQRRRRQAEAAQQGPGNIRSSLAVAHEEWLRKKNEETMKATRKEEMSKQEQTLADDRTVHKSGTARSSAASGDGKEKHVAWEAWLERKHREEVAELDEHIRQEKQLLFGLRQRKQPAVVAFQC